MEKSFTILCMLFVGFLFTGCSSSVYFKTEKDPMVTILPTQRYKIYLPDNPTIEDKKFFITLKDKMFMNKFLLTDGYDFDYGIFFNIVDKTYNNTGTTTNYVPQTSHSYGFVGNNYVRTTTTTNQPVTESYSYTKTYKKIYVELLTIKANQEGKHDTVWSGFVSLNSDEYDRASDDMVNKLVGLIGKEFKGDKTVNWTQKNR